MSKERFSKCIISLIIAANIIFTIAVLYVFVKTGSEPVVLIGAWFSFMSVEVWQLAQIKKTKELNKNE